MEEECVICLDEECVIVFEPCGHYCVCYHCAKTVQECPICRSAIENKRISELKWREAQEYAADVIMAGKKRCKVTLEQDGTTLKVEYTVKRTKMEDEFVLVKQEDIGNATDPVELAAFDPQRYWSQFYYENGNLYK